MVHAGGWAQHLAQCEHPRPMLSLSIWTLRSFHSHLMWASSPWVKTGELELPLFHCPSVFRLQLNSA